MPGCQLICHHIKTHKMFWRPTTWFNVTAPSPTETRKKDLPQARKAREGVSSKTEPTSFPVASIVRQEKHDENDTHSRRCVVGNDSCDEVRTSEKEWRQIVFGHRPVCHCAKTRHIGPCRQSRGHRRQGHRAKKGPLQKPPQEERRIAIIESLERIGSITAL